jgi:dTDP-4-dehydrorhamnose reductase
MGTAVGFHPRLEAIRTEEYFTPARRPRDSRLDSSKAERVFGIRFTNLSPFS